MPHKKSRSIKKLCMKKLSLLCFIFGFSAFSFGMGTESRELESENFNELVNVSYSSAIVGGCYSVSFELPCNGQAHTEWYCTNYSEGESGFIRDLAYVVNVAVEEGC